MMPGVIRHSISSRSRDVWQLSSLMSKKVTSTLS